MAITTPNMGLKRWDQATDIFSYTELSDNLNALDLHDHSTGKGVQIPTTGIANQAVTEVKLANSAVTATKIAPLAVTDAALASENNSVHRMLLHANAAISQNLASGVYGFGDTANSVSLVLSGTATTVPVVALLRWNPTNYTVASKPSVMKVNVGGGTNGTAPGVNFTFGLYPVSSVGGAANQLSLTFGTVVGSVAVATPTANTIHLAQSADFAAPAAGLYALGVSISGTTAANSLSQWGVQLQLRHT